MHAANHLPRSWLAPLLSQVLPSTYLTGIDTCPAAGELRGYDPSGRQVATPSPPSALSLVLPSRPGEIGHPCWSGQAQSPRCPDSDQCGPEIQTWGSLTLPHRSWVARFLPGQCVKPGTPELGFASLSSPRQGRPGELPALVRVGGVPHRLGNRSGSRQSSAIQTGSEVRLQSSAFTDTDTIAPPEGAKSVPQCRGPDSTSGALPEASRDGSPLGSHLEPLRPCRGGSGAFGLQNWRPQSP
eukprot:scaffold2675_cov398-Prasinococcus_capsulatus_cf.AAC.5